MFTIVSFSTFSGRNSWAMFWCTWRAVITLTSTRPSGWTMRLEVTFSQPSKEKCICEVLRIGSIIICHLSKLWKTKFFILCDVILLVRLQEKFEIDHSWEWKGGCWNRVYPVFFFRVCLDFSLSSSWPRKGSFLCPSPILARARRGGCRESTRPCSWISYQHWDWPSWSQVGHARRLALTNTMKALTKG